MADFKALFKMGKVKTAGITLREFIKKSASKGQSINDDATQRANTDLTLLKDSISDTKETVRALIEVNPDMSQAFSSLASLVITDTYTVVAHSVEDGSIDIEGTKYTNAAAARIDKLPPAFDGFYPQSSFSATSETLLKDLVTNGTMGGELILDKGMTPAEIRPFSTNSLKYQQAAKRFYPVITVDSEEIILDSPAVQIISLYQSPSTPYSVSYYNSAVGATYAAESYRSDSIKAYRRTAHPRIRAALDAEKIIEQMPMEVRYDSEKLATALSAAITQVQDELNGLEPEDAIVAFNSVNIDAMSAGNISSHDTIATHAKIVDGNQASGLKTLPSILGRGESQTTASSESVLFVKQAEAIQNRLNEMFSSLLTLAARLNGFDVIVTFKYAKPSLRTESESESFTVMKQSRIYELLSFGNISDEEASIELTGKLPPATYTPLSGTRFRDIKETETADNAYSNTSVSSKGITATKTQKDSSGEKKPKSNSTTGS